MKKVLLTAVCLITGLLGITMANQDLRYMYHFSMDAHNLSCTNRLNGLLIYSTETLDEDIPKNITLGYSITEYVDNGENELSVELINLSRFLTPTEIEEAYCNVTIDVTTKDFKTGETSNKEITSIRATYELGELNGEHAIVLTTKESKKYEDNTLTGAITEEEMEMLPPELEQRMIRRKFNNIYPSNFSWVQRATPFKDTPENRQLLWSKYQELQDAIESRSPGKIRKLAEPGLTDMAIYQNRGTDDRFNLIMPMLFDDFFALDFKLWKIPNYIGREQDYNLELYAGGKLFRFVQKEYFADSPLKWEKKYSKEVIGYNPVFTYIDGKIVMAVF